MGWVVSVTPWPRFSPGERIPGTHCTVGWVGPRAGLDTEVRRKILRLCRGSNLDHPVIQPVARHYTDWATRLTIQFIHSGKIIYSSIDISEVNNDRTFPKCRPVNLFPCNAQLRCKRSPFSFVWVQNISYSNYAKITKLKSKTNHPKRNTRCSKISLQSRQHSQYWHRWSWRVYENCLVSETLK
jgi:hypothetical protein